MIQEQPQRLKELIIAHDLHSAEFTVSMTQVFIKCYIKISLKAGTVYFTF